ncbi:MAG: hypothetical protein ACT4PY_10720 [Armatimonadota bacterium]
MFRKIVLALLVLAIVPLVVPYYASASHRTRFRNHNGWNHNGWNHNGSLHCVTVTSWQPVSQFVLSTNGVFVQVVQVQPVKQIQCFPVQTVQPVVLRKVVVIKQNGHFKKFKRKVIVVHRRVHDDDDDDDDD